MTTPDLLNALADLIEAITLSSPIHPPMRRVCTALGLPENAPWPAVVVALRTHATTLTPGLPEGWAWDEDGPGAYTTSANGYVQAEGGRFWIEDGQDVALAPTEVVRAVLARAGVVS